MTRSRRRFHVALDVRCRDHDRRMGLLWVDARQPDTVCSRLPGGAALPDGWTAARLACPVCGLWVGVGRDRVAAVLRNRAEVIGPSTCVWPVWQGERVPWGE